jgi:hypothetical protein
VDLVETGFLLSCFAHPDDSAAKPLPSLWRKSMLRRLLVALFAVVLGTSLLAATQASAAPQQSHVAAPRSDDGSPTADQLLAKTAHCNQVSNGTYSDKNGGQTPICGASGAYFWTSGMAIDCDGQRTSACNENTDCCFYNDTSFHQSDGKPFDAAKVPYVVIPLPSSRWDYGNAGIRGGDVLAVIYHGHVEYAVFGDEGPDDSIGEASYATAKALGIDPDPSNGGTSDKVTYIVFKNSGVSPIENHGSAVTQGRKFAQQFVNGS